MPCKMLHRRETARSSYRVSVHSFRTTLTCTSVLFGRRFDFQRLYRGHVYSAPLDPLGASPGPYSFPRSVAGPRFCAQPRRLTTMAEDEFTLPSQILTRRLQYLTVSYVEMSVESTPQIPGMGGGAGIGNWPSHTPNTPTTPVFQLGMSSLQLAGPPHSTHPGLSSHPNYGYHVSSVFPGTVDSE